MTVADSQMTAGGLSPSPVCPTVDTGGGLEMKEVKRRWSRDLLRRSSFSRKNQLARVLWHVAYGLLFRFSPRFLHAWRRWLLRCFGAKVGRGVRTFPNIKVWAPWNLQLGDYASIGDGVDCYSVGRLVLGDYATVSQYSVLCTATHDYAYLHCPLRVSDIYIQSYAWVCAQSFIMPGVTVGEGTVVGARSTVLRSLPAWKVAVGTPCRVISPRRVRV